LSWGPNAWLSKRELKLIERKLAALDHWVKGSLLENEAVVYEGDVPAVASGLLGPDFRVGWLLLAPLFAADDFNGVIRVAMFILGLLSVSLGLVIWKQAFVAVTDKRLLIARLGRLSKTPLENIACPRDLVSVRGYRRGWRITYAVLGLEVSKRKMTLSIPNNMWWAAADVIQRTLERPRP
jgi:hypothetical protein